MPTWPCSECGETLNITYPLRLVAEGGPSVAPTRLRHLCMGCIEATTTMFRLRGTDCPACADLALIFTLVIEAIQGSTPAAVHVPPNRHPHSDGCPYESHAKDSV